MTPQVVFIVCVSTNGARALDRPESTRTIAAVMLPATHFANNTVGEDVDVRISRRGVSYMARKIEIEIKYPTDGAVERENQICPFQESAKFAD